MNTDLWALPLDDMRWRRLKRAYSAPKDFLTLLAELEADPLRATRIAERFSDGNHVCHQFGPSETTIAVVPYFVRAAARVPAPYRGRILEEVGFYATLLGVPLPPNDRHLRPDGEVREGYDIAVRVAVELFAEVLPLPCNETEAILRCATLAGLQGHRRLATVLYKQRIHGCQQCPRCGAEFDPLDEWGRGF